MNVGLPLYDILVWTFIGFISGSVPWSLICVKAFSGMDVRSTGDGNPGATNAWILSGWVVGSISMTLDICKALIPVWVAINYYIPSSDQTYPLSLALISMAPIVGHAYSPVLRLKGGKALAPSWGSWIALTSGVAFPVALIILGLMHLTQKNHALTVTICLIGFIVIFAIFGTRSLALFGVLNLMLVIFKHRTEYQKGFVFRSWVRT